MSVEPSEAAANAMLDALALLMDGGSIELRSDDRVLVTLKLSDPATMPATAGELEFNDIAENDVVARGAATSARILGPDGFEILSCDVGDENSDAVIKLKGTTQMFPGQPVQLRSFRLVMPHE